MASPRPSHPRTQADNSLLIHGRGPPVPTTPCNYSDELVTASVGTRRAHPVTAKPAWPDSWLSPPLLSVPCGPRTVPGPGRRSAVCRCPCVPRAGALLHRGTVEVLGGSHPPGQREGLAPNPPRVSQSSRGRGCRAGGGGGASACPAPASQPEPQREESKALLRRRRPGGSPGGGEASRGRGSWEGVQSVAAGDGPRVCLSLGLRSPLTESDPPLPCTPWSMGVRYGWKTRSHLSAPPPCPRAVPATQAVRTEVAPGPPRLLHWDGGRRGQGGGQLLPGPRGGGACGHTASSDGSPAPGLPAAGQATLGAKTKKEEACVHLHPLHHTPLL